MTQDAGMIGQAGLQFFGTMCASVSHDIKNVLAVINENAGLLEDFCLMAEKGRPIDPARLKRLAGDIQEQIRRGDRIVTGMNRFAHSADASSMDVDLAELADLLAALALRFAAARGVQVHVKRPLGTVRITTAPFVLLNLMWLCLDEAMAFAGPERTVELAAEDSADVVRLRFCRIHRLKDTPDGSLPTALSSALCSFLRAQVLIDPDANEMTLLLPKTCG
jgi:K+-sensing histidine kinase KdpD